METTGNYQPAPGLITPPAHGQSSRLVEEASKAKRSQWTRLLQALPRFLGAMSDARAAAHELPAVLSDALEAWIAD